MDPTPELLTMSVGIGLVVSLVFAETFGIAAGGMIVPGYLALYLNRPADIAFTILAAFATLIVVRTAGAFTILFGRRRTVAMILVGFFLGALTNQLLPSLPSLQAEHTRLIGYIIPGLIAIWLDRQGVVETLSALSAASILVHFVLLLLFGSELP